VASGAFVGSAAGAAVALFAALLALPPVELAPDVPALGVLAVRAAPAALVLVP
jgi:hypothetical protein